MDPNRESGVGSDADNMAELAALLTTDIPEGRSNLADSHSNLERVADYCEGNYFQSENKRAALEETKNYTTQSLASVAYQINTLAYNFLQLLDLQGTRLSGMESQMNHITMTVMIHKEKVARREIGVLTANKTTLRQYKIIAPANPEKPIKYVRKPIDYTALDDIGHGVKATSGGTPRAKRGSSQGSIQSIGPPPAAVAAMGASVGPAPTTKPPTPPQSIRAGAVGSLTKGSREYRTPPAVAPPQVPSHYAPNYPLGHPRRGERAAGYSILPMPPSAHMHAHTLPHHSSSQMSAGVGVPPLSPPPPQVGLVHPMPSHATQMQQQTHPQTPPPPPPPTTGIGYNVADHHTSMPPPPSPLTVSMASGGDMMDHALHQHTLPHHHHHHHHHPAAQMHQHHMHQTFPHQPHSQLAHLSMHGQVTGGSATIGHPPGGMHHQQQQVVLNQHGRAVGNAMAHLHHHVPQQQPGNISPPLPPPPPPGEGREEEEDDDDDDGGFGRVPNVMRGGMLHGIVPAEADLPGWVPKNYIEKVVAIYDYYADKEDELSFQESAVIYVLKKNDDGWWEGVMEGITGLFPGNYVEPCM
ncbi:abl interactor 2 [Hetaerina americana]|uniref:abl interactor 2 n=1 Tax=Hetaerina americana TaxID=62018 RepID=UPI003A7F5BBF